MTVVTTRPEEVLSYHARLTATLANPHPMLSTYMCDYMNRTMQRGGPGSGEAMFAPIVEHGAMYATVSDGGRMAQVLSRDLSQAVTYEVTAEMTDIMKQVAEKHVPVDVLDQAELPAESGVAWLDDGWDLLDRHGRTYVIRALSWRFVVLHPEGAERFARPTNWPCVRIALWVHPSDDPPEYENALDREELGGLQAMHVGIIPLGQSLSTLPTETAAAGSFLEMVHLIWMFLGMELTATATPRIKNHYRKHALKSLVHDEVRVVTLRRVRYVTEQGEQDAHRIDWSCRWPVQGHYRHLSNPNAVPGAAVHRAVPIDFDKHCAVCGGKLTYVRPYLKGPDGLPLKVSRTLMKLAR